MKYKIKDVADLNHSSIKKDELSNILYLDTANLNQNTINELTEYNFVTDKVPSRARRKVNNNDILLSTVRPNQEHYGILNNPPANLIVSTGFAVLSPKKDIVNPFYLYAYLTQRRITDYLQIIAENSTSAYPSIKPSVIANLDIELPCMDKQNYIGAFSKKLEDKIKLNNQVITTLEELAATLFKRWFVDFEFPDEKGNPYKSSGGEMVDSELGEIPAGFHVRMLSDIAEIVGGGTPSKKMEEYYLDGEIPWITPKDLSINKENFVGRGKVSITELGLKKSSAKIIPKNSILFSSRAPIGYIAIAKNEVCTNQGFKSLVPNNEIPFQFIFLFMKNNISKIESIATGSTFKEISGSAMKSYKSILPVEELLKQFDKATISLFDKIEKCEEENSKLISLRDTLLPKLLSGEIEIPQGEDV